MHALTDDVDGELARDCGVVLWVADDLMCSRHELRTALNAADVTQLTSSSTDEHWRRPRHVTCTSQ